MGSSRCGGRAGFRITLSPSRGARHIGPASAGVPCVEGIIKFERTTGDI